MLPVQNRKVCTLTITAMKLDINKLLVCSLLLSAVAVSGYAQESRRIQGKVYEKDKKEALTGVVIKTIDNAIGTQTDADGAFELVVPQNTGKLVVSYVGYTTDTIVLKSDNTLNIQLEKPRALKEVVVKRRRGSTEIGLLDAIKTERIGERELLKAACCNLSESFETTPSVDVAFTDAVSGYKQIQMLGLSGPYTLITRENIPDTRGLASVTGLTFTPGTWIEGMQLSKGTGSVVNGYESVAGQINVELQKPFEDKEPKWLFNLYQNTQGRTEGNVVYRHQLNKALSTNVFLHGKSQWMRVDQNNDGFMDQPMDQQFVALNRWFWFGPNSWEVQGGVKGVYSENTGGQYRYNRGTEQVSGNPWGYEMGTQRIEGWAKIGKMFTNKSGTSIGLQLAALQHEQDALYGTRNYTASQSSFYTNLIFQTILGNTNHVLKTGLSNVVDIYDEQLKAQKYAREEYVPGAFVEYAYNAEKLNIVAGMRGDYHNLYGAFATPRLHVRYSPFANTSIRASVGRAQRTANILAENIGFMASNRSFIVQGAQPNKAYGLDAEVAWNTGINLTQKFRLNYRDGSFSVDYYYTDFTNQVVVDVEDPHSVRFYNLAGKSFANSFQAQFDYELVHNLNVRLAYRFYDVQSTYSGQLKQRPLLAPHRAFANVGYETKNGWKFDYTIQWVGTKRVPSVHEHHGGAVVAESQSPTFIQMNAQVSKAWNQNFEVYVGGENLTHYMQHNMVIGANDPFGQAFDASMVWGPVMGRNIYAGLRYKIR
jgi:outer membrane receptor for ferrienterochelin and colicins